MAQFEQHFVQDLTQPIKIRHCGTIVFNADDESNVVSVRLFNGSEPVAISGSVVGAVVCSDGSTVTLAGSYSGNTASITLTGDCFAILGQIGVGIQIVNGTQKTTVLKAIYNVETLTTENEIDPGSRITLEVGDLISDIETATAAIPASDMASLMSGIAPTFSDSVTYKAGAYVYYGGDLYCFTADHNGGTWTGSDVTAAVLCNDVSDLKSASESNLIYDNKLLNIKGNLLPLYVKRYSGVIVNEYQGKLLLTTNASYVTYIVRVKQNTTYHGNHFRYYAMLESDMVTLIGSRGESSTTFSTGEAYYAAFSFATGDYPEESYVFNEGTVKTDTPTEVAFNYSAVPINQTNLLQSASVYLNNYYNTDFHPNQSNYTVFVFPVVSGKKYIIETQARYISKSGTVIEQNKAVGYEYTADFTGDLYLTLYNEERAGWAVYESTVPPCYVPAYDSKYTSALDSVGILTGKTWYACGDSFTAGDFTGDTDGHVFTNNPYFGKNMVYSYYIGRRTGAFVKNIAANGMTLATVSGRTNDFISVYQNIGADADYITFKFGINDGHQSVPIGTVNSNDTSTFYGAWNTVLTWFVANRPKAKLGIIVSNGLDDNSYAEATIAIAKKYGIPYLNEWNGENVPVMLRTGRTDVSAAVKTARDELFRVSASNTHPNVFEHDWESRFIESWLKTL